MITASPNCRQRHASHTLSAVCPVRHCARVLESLGPASTIIPQQHGDRFDRAEPGSAHRAEPGTRSRRGNQQHPAQGGAPDALHLDPRVARSGRCAHADQPRAAHLRLGFRRRAADHDPAEEPDRPHRPGDRARGAHCGRSPHRCRDGPRCPRCRLAGKLGAPAGGDAAGAAGSAPRARVQLDAEVRARGPQAARSSPAALE